MSCDGTGYMIGCPGCWVCEDEMAEVRANVRSVVAALAAMSSRSPRTAPVDVDPWGDPINRQEPTT